jgi:hypothetical protein
MLDRRRPRRGDLMVAMDDIGIGRGGQSRIRPLGVQ